MNHPLQIITATPYPYSLSINVEPTYFISQSCIITINDYVAISTTRTGGQYVYGCGNSSNGTSISWQITGQCFSIRFGGLSNHFFRTQHSYNLKSTLFMILKYLLACMFTNPLFSCS